MFSFPFTVIFIFLSAVLQESNMHSLLNFLFQTWKKKPSFIFSRVGLLFSRCMSLAPFTSSSSCVWTGWWTVGPRPISGGISCCWPLIFIVSIGCQWIGPVGIFAEIAGATAFPLGEVN